tara:strand:+ start:2181 stop:4688 length:2508 start_codon:yes stop_codon:yes gene_type:complete
MSFENLEAEKQDELLKAINNQSPRRVINKFEGQIREDGLKILVLLSLEGSIILNENTIFSQTNPNITRANYNNKLDEANILFGTTLQPAAKTGLSYSENFDKDPDSDFVDMYEFGRKYINDKNFIRGMEVIVDEILGPEYTEQPKTPSNVAINSIRSFIRKYDIESPENRKEIYKYWSEVYRERWTGLLEILNNIVLGSNLFTSESLEDITNKTKEAFTNTRLPNYITVLSRPGIKSQAEDDVSALELANVFVTEFAKLSTEDMEEYQRRFGKRVKDLKPTERTRDAEGRELDAPQIEIEDTTLEAATDDALELETEIQQVQKTIDPLTAFSIYGKQDLLMSAESMEKVKEKIMAEISNMEFGEALNNLIDDIDNFVNEIQDDIVTLDQYAFSILDDLDSVNVVDRIYGNITFVYEYYNLNIEENRLSDSLTTINYDEQTGSMTEETRNVEQIVLVAEKNVKTFNDYGKFVEQINKDAKNFFKSLATLTKLRTQTNYIYNEWTQYGKRETGAAIVGGDLPSIPGMEAKMEDDYIQVLEAIEDYYFTSMDPTYFYDKDSPNFTKSSEYQSFKSIIDKKKGKPISRVKSRLRRFGSVDIDEQDLVNIKKWSREIKKGSRLGISADVIKIFEDALDSLVNIQFSFSEGTGRKAKQKSTKIYQDLLGRELYEIADRNNLTDEEIEEIEFKREPLSKYSNVTPQRGLDAIYEILDDKDFMDYAKKEKFHRELNRLKNELRSNRRLQQPDEIENMSISKAYISALDTLKIAKGEQIYIGHLLLEDIDDIEFISNMIKKEDKIDIFAKDIEGIVESTSSFNTISKSFGVSEEIIYKVKGMFR